MERHKPDKWVAGVYDEYMHEWKGRFEATAKELIEYSETEVDCADTWVLVMEIATVTQWYEEWWDELKRREM